MTGTMFNRCTKQEQQQQVPHDRGRTWHNLQGCRASMKRLSLAMLLLRTAAPILLHHYVSNMLHNKLISNVTYLLCAVLEQHRPVLQCCHCSSQCGVNLWGIILSKVSALGLHPPVIMLFLSYVITHSSETRYVHAAKVADRSERVM